MDTKEGHLEIINASKIYDPEGVNVLAVDNCSFEIRAGEFVAIVGPSGCGKTTLLNMTAGFEDISRGEIRMDGQVIAGPGRTPRPGPGGGLSGRGPVRLDDSAAEHHVRPAVHRRHE